VVRRLVTVGSNTITTTISPDTPPRRAAACSIPDPVDSPGNRPGDRQHDRYQQNHRYQPCARRSCRTDRRKWIRLDTSGTEPGTRDERRRQQDESAVVQGFWPASRACIDEQNTTANNHHGETENQHTETQPSADCTPRVTARRRLVPPVPARPRSTRSNGLRGLFTSAHRRRQTRAPDARRAVRVRSDASPRRRGSWREADRSVRRVRTRAHVSRCRQRPAPGHADEVQRKHARKRARNHSAPCGTGHRNA